MKKLICFLVILMLVFNTVPVDALSVSAGSAVLIDAVSGEVLFSKNPDQKMPMASTTKIMTALLLCEYGSLDREITVTPEMVYVEGTSMGLKVGMKVRLENILYGMLLASGNDAANAAAIAVGGGIDNFVSIMNDKARELGLENTHFDTPSGLDGDTHYTTSYDLAMLSRYALNNADFLKACSAKSKTIDLDGTKITLTNHNKLLKVYDDAIGVKTGFTKKSGRCLVSAAQRKGGRVIAVTLNDGNDWQDHIDMLNYGFSCLEDEAVSFLAKQYEIPVLFGSKESITAVSNEVEFRTTDSADIIKNEYIYPYLLAPVKKGDEIGYVEYKCNDYTVSKQILYANENVDETDSGIKFLLKVKNVFLTMFKSV